MSAMEVIDVANTFSFRLLFGFNLCFDYGNLHFYHAF
jgi:hypothetical protein